MMASSSLSSSQPVTLKDFLFQEAKPTVHFNSSMERPQETVRNLLEMELRAGQEEARPTLMKSRSKSACAAITKLQAASEALVRAAKLLRLASPASKSQPLSKKSRSRRKPEDLDGHSRILVRIKDIMRWKSLNEAQLVLECRTGTNNESRSSVSSSHGWTETEPPPDVAPSPESWSPEFSSSQESKNRVGEGGEAASTSYGDQEAKGGRRSANQLSPISVLEFPDEDSNSPSSSGFPNVDRSCQPKLATVDLVQRLDLSADRDDTRRKNDRLEEVEDKAKELLELVKRTCTGDGIGQTVEKLLLDFFQEAAAAAEGEEEAVTVAVEWAERGGEEAEKWWEEESLTAAVREMEEDDQWRATEEAAAVAAAVEGGVLESMMEELVAGLRLR